MKNCIQSNWKTERLKTDPANKAIGWLNGKWCVMSFSENDEGCNGNSNNHIRENIKLTKALIRDLPNTGSSRGLKQEDIHECRIYAVIGQKLGTLPCFQEGGIQRIRMTKLLQVSDVGFILSALSMQDSMYSDECQLIGWSATKFDEGPLSGYVTIDFYIKGDQQVLYNELKWYLLNEFRLWYPSATNNDSFCYIKKHLPPDTIYYNIAYDTKKVVCELINRIKELKEVEGRLFKDEREDLKQGLAYYKGKITSPNTDLMDTLQTIISEY
jgi:hypothetical protein